MTKLTTHVLDVYSGKPGKGIKVDLFYFNGTNKERINSITLNDDGRSNQPLAEKENFKSGLLENIIGTNFLSRNFLNDSKDSQINLICNIAKFQLSTIIIQNNLYSDC